jgi:hypothetical protein
MRFLFGFIWMAIHGPPIYALVGISFRRVAVLYGQALGLTLAAILPAALARLFLPTGDLTPLVLWPLPAWAASYGWRQFSRRITQPQPLYVIS